jgi:hypothetical protein
MHRDDVRVGSRVRSVHPGNEEVIQPTGAPVAECVVPLGCVDRDGADVAARAVPVGIRGDLSALVVDVGDHIRPVADERRLQVPSFAELLDLVHRPGRERQLGEEVEDVRPRFGEAELEVPFVSSLCFDACEQVR